MMASGHGLYGAETGLLPTLFAGKTLLFTEKPQPLFPAAAILLSVQARSSPMPGNQRDPIWNEDLVSAIGLAFAGMAVLEGKLFAAAGKLNLQCLNALLDWKGLEWWPLLLIASGVVLWVRRSRDHSAIRGGNGS
jgi:hypothetical protein